LAQRLLGSSERGAEALEAGGKAFAERAAAEAEGTAAAAEAAAASSAAEATATAATTTTLPAAVCGPRLGEALLDRRELRDTRRLEGPLDVEPLPARAELGDDLRDDPLLVLGEERQADGSRRHARK